jgi:hypothetical protein
MGSGEITIGGSTRPWGFGGQAVPQMTKELPAT